MPRAHRFFAAARWQADQLGLAVCDLIVARLLDADAPILLVADDSLFKRTGRTVFGAGWHYDAAASGRKRTAWGNNWVVVGVLVRLPFVPHRMVCLPVLALVSTDLDSTPAELVERYADRWSVEVLFEESRQVAGVGQAPPA
jgi:hypothetical protein